MNTYRYNVINNNKEKLQIQVQGYNESETKRKAIQICMRCKLNLI